MHRRLAILAVCCVVAVIPGRACAASSPPLWLMTAATNISVKYGDVLPLWGKFVTGTQRDVLRLVGARGVSRRPAYVLVLRGQFTQPGQYTPGTVPPAGTIVTAVIGATDHRVLRVRLGNTAPNLARLGAVGPIPWHTAGLRPPNIAPRQLVARYFADLNAQRWYAAYLLEATCTSIFTEPDAPGYGAMGARPARWTTSRFPPVLRAARVTGIRRFHDPTLTRNRYLGFAVSAWLRFVYPPVGSEYAGNDERPTGNHVVKMILHRCDGRWGIDAGWLGAGGPWNWT